MKTSLDVFAAKLRGLFSQARENLEKKERGETDYDFTVKDFSFPTIDGITTKSGLGQFGHPAYVPWINFVGSDQKPQKGIYPVILCYLKQHTIMVTYGISAKTPPKLQWGTVLNKEKQSPLTIGEFFRTKSIKIENHDYDDSFVYSSYTDALNDHDVAQIYNDLSEMLTVYKKVLNLPTTATDSSNTDIPKSFFDINTFVEKIQSTGLIYSDRLIKRFAYSLMSKPFVILSGLAGSGKTQLALSFAKCLSEDINDQVCTVAVGADWTNREPLLGYPNALKKEEYVLPESKVLQLLLRANKNREKPYFLILDEMNLSVVERYFADFLSAMESGEAIKLWDVNTDKNGDTKVPTEIKLCNNVYVIGTINVDETTYMFSPKVLDRANVIEFKITHDDMRGYLDMEKDINVKRAYSACADMAEDFVNKTKNKGMAVIDEDKDILMNFFTELKKVNAEFGYRSVNEIARYIGFAGKELGDNGAIDTAILQKLLPKLHGSRKKLVPVLTTMWRFCLNDDMTVNIDDELTGSDFKRSFLYPESAEKIQRMYKAVIDNGFTSYAEA